VDGWVGKFTKNPNKKDWLNIIRIFDERACSLVSDVSKFAGKYGFQNKQ